MEGFLLKAGVPSKSPTVTQGKQGNRLPEGLRGDLPAEALSVGGSRCGDLLNVQGGEGRGRAAGVHVEMKCISSSTKL